ncbi:hypothetical protein [Daejeonella rubra]|nr:hypothetical protein [Daejeonella rubra]
MELRTLIALKLKKFSNRKVVHLLNINRKTVDGYIKRFKELEITYGELSELCESDLNDLFTEESQAEKQSYEKRIFLPITIPY